MRKTLSVILCVLMILSACSFAIPASAAPEGTAINTADEFMAMAAEGKYYLASDITLAGTYPNAFVGTFDGNGHTVTVTNPMFNDFSGEVKNLTIKGEIVYTDSDVAAFTIYSATGFNATNCTNNANITASGAFQDVGGFVAYTEKNETPCVFTNCVNNGNIYCTPTNDKYHSVGGFGGRVNSVQLFNCTNNGNLYSMSEVTYMGGLVAIIAYEAGANHAEAFNCTNNGNLTCLDTYILPDTNAPSNGGSEAGGMFCEVGCSGNAAWYKVWGCVNNGTIESTGWTGGLVGYSYGSGSTAFMDIQFCINTGDIIYGRTAKKNDEAVLYDWASPFITYTNSAYTTIKYNIDIGKLVKHEGAVTANPGQVFCGLSSADALQYDVKYNYILNYDQFQYFTYASSDDNAANRHEISATNGIIPVTLEEIKSGKIAHTLNTESAKDDYGYATFDEAFADLKDKTYAFYQKIGSADLPTASYDEIAGAWIVLDGTTYKNGEKAEATTEEITTEAPVVTDAPTEAPAETDAPTEAPAETDAPAQTDAPADTEAPKGGCGGMITGVVAVVAILGTALIVKKRD